MPDPIRIDFGTQSDPGRFGHETGPRHINTYVAKVEEGQGPNGLVYYASDGFDEFSTDYAAASTGTRGIIDFQNGCLALIGNQLAFIDTAGGGTAIGGIPGSARVITAKNNASTPQAVITVDGSKYVVTPAGGGAYTLAEITDTDLPAANSCAFLNRRILYGIADGRMFWSDVDDATAISALNFITAEGDPDGLTRVFTHDQEAWLFGEKTTEVWRDTGAATAPFRRNTAGVIDKGSLSPHSIAALDKDLIWLGDDGSVYRAVGYDFQRISHHGVEESIKGSDLSQIFAFTRLSRGHHFYTLSSTNDGWTWEWNRTTQRWIERQSHLLDFWRINTACETGDGGIVLGDYDNGKLYKLNSSTFTEGSSGNHLIMKLRSAPQHAFPNRLCVYRLLADFRTGVGLVDAGDDHDSDPQVGLRYSDDGGACWSNEITRPLGKIGETDVSVDWTDLGVTGRSGRIWELTISSPVIRALTNNAIEADLVGT